MMSAHAPPQKILRAPRPCCLLSACRHDPVRSRPTRPIHALALSCRAAHRIARALLSRARRVRPTDRFRVLRRTRVANDRPVSRRPDGRVDRRARTAERLLHRRQQRRRLEDDRLRRTCGADLRRPADRIDRRARRRAVESRTSSTSAAARDCSGPTSRSATASTSRPTPARRGRIWACATASRSRRSSSTRAIPIASSSPCSVIPTGRTPSAACSARTDGGETLREGALQGREHRRRSTSRSIPAIRRLIYAVLWAARQGPWENGARTPDPGSGLFKSTDGGTTWKPLTGGLPDAGAGARPHRHRRRARAIPSHLRHGRAPPKLGGVYRSDDAGETWTRMNSEERV